MHAYEDFLDPEHLDKVGLARVPTLVAWERDRLYQSGFYCLLICHRPAKVAKQSSKLWPSAFLTCPSLREKRLPQIMLVFRHVEA